MAKELLTREMLYPYGEFGGRLYVHPSLNMQKIASFFRVSHQFAADECHFQHEQTNEPAKGYHHLTEDQKAACLMAAKRLIDASISGDRVHLECARGYMRDL